MSYRLAQHVRPPDLPRSRLFKKAVTRGVTLHPDRIEPRPGIGDREIQAECSAVARPCWSPSLRFHEVFDGFRKAVVLVIPEIVFRAFLRNHPVKQGPARIASAFGYGPGISGGASSYLFLSDAGASGIVLIDSRGVRRLNAVIDPDGAASIERFGPDGKPLL